MSTLPDYTTYTDAQLNTAFQAAENGGPSQDSALIAISAVIATREQNPLFIGKAALGFASPFPAYDAAGQFNPTQAIQSGLSAHAGQVVNDIGNGIGSIMKATAPLWIAGGVLVVIVAAIYFRK